MKNRKKALDSSPPIRFSSDHLHSVPPPLDCSFPEFLSGFDYEYPLNPRNICPSLISIIGSSWNRPDHLKQRTEEVPTNTLFFLPSILLSTCHKHHTPRSGLLRVCLRMATPANRPPRLIRSEILICHPRGNTLESMITIRHQTGNGELPLRQSPASPLSHPSKT